MLYVVDCSHPQPPTNGSLGEYVKTTKGSNLTFQCNDGYIPSIVMTAICIDGVWDPPPEEHNCTENQSK